MKYDKETNTVWYSEEEVVNCLLWFGDKWEIPEEGVMSGDFNYIQFKDHQLFKDLFQKFATAKGFRKSIVKAGLVGKDFSKSTLGEPHCKATVKPVDLTVEKDMHKEAKELMDKDYATDKLNATDGKHE